MPLLSLRWRRKNDPLPPQEDHETPSPYRAQSLTLSGLSPRKSLQSLSLFGSARKRSGTVTGITQTPTSTGNQQQVVEEGVYQRDDNSNIGRRLHRAPSPYPERISRSDSLTIPTQPRERRTFLETVADAIRAPASWFYKKKPRLEDGGPLIDNNTHNETNSSTESPPSPTKTVSSKKSVRFRSGRSVIDNETRSSPIAIPKPNTVLPTMTSTTPLMQYFGRDHPHMIPTGRPREPSVLQSNTTFFRAKENVNEDNILNITPLGSPVSDPASPAPHKSEPLQNPFDDPKDDFDTKFDEEAYGADDSQPRVRFNRNTNIVAGRQLSARRPTTPEFRKIDPRIVNRNTTSPLAALKTKNVEESPVSKLIKTGQPKFYLGDGDSSGGISDDDPDPLKERRIAEWAVRTSQLFEGPPAQTSSSEPTLGSPFPGHAADEIPVSVPSTVLDENSSINQGVAARRDFYSPTTYIQNPPWTADLPFRRESESAEKLAKEVDAAVQRGRLSSFSEEMGQNETRFSNPVHIEATDGVTDRPTKLLATPDDRPYGLKPQPDPFPHRVPSFELKNQLPALIPLPGSPRQHAQQSDNLRTDESGDFSSGEEEDDSQEKLDIPQDSRINTSMTTTSSEEWTGTRDPYLHADDAIAHRQFSQSTSMGASLETSAFNDEENLAPELRGHLEPTGQSFMIPQSSADRYVSRQLTRAADFTERIISTNDSSFRVFDEFPQARAAYVEDEPEEEDMPMLPETPARHLGSDSAVGDRGVTLGSSDTSPTMFSAATSRRQTGQTTDTSDAMEEDEVMCKGIV